MKWLWEQRAAAAVAELEVDLWLLRRLSQCAPVLAEFLGSLGKTDIVRLKKDTFF